eukprot:SAG22_NODE_6040_length_911_cov_0.860837_1_plen_124_part_01
MSSLAPALSRPDDEMTARLKSAAVSGAHVSAEAKKPNSNKRKMQELSVREAARTGSESSMRAMDTPEGGLSTADEEYMRHATASLHKFLDKVFSPLLADGAWDAGQENIKPAAKETGVKLIRGG